MVKRVEVTYVGGHKETIRYDIRFRPSEDGIVKFRYNNKDTEVNMTKVLQIKELS